MIVTGIEDLRQTTNMCWETIVVDLARDVVGKGKNSCHRMRDIVGDCVKGLDCVLQYRILNRVELVFALLVDVLKPDDVGIGELGSDDRFIQFDSL